LLKSRSFWSSLQLVAALEDARTAARVADGVLRIGFSPTSSVAALTRLTGAFEDQHPDCRAVLDGVSNLDPIPGYAAANSTC